MTWDAVSTIAQLGSTVAVFVTLIYLAMQVRIANQQRQLDAFRHTYDSLNLFCDKMAESKEIASIIHRGRPSMENIDEDEKIIFQHVHLHLLNSIESWYMQVMRTSKEEEYRNLQLRSIEGVLAYYLQYPGSQELWNSVENTFEPIQDIVNKSIA